MSRECIDPRLDGYVSCDPVDVLALVGAKRLRLIEAEANAHQKRIDDIVRVLSRPERYFWMPWKFKPVTITYEKAAAMYADPDEIRYSRKDFVRDGYQVSHNMLDVLEKVAFMASRPILLSVRTLGWLGGFGNEDA